MATDLALFAALFAGTREDYRLEQRFRRKDGRDLWGQLTVSLLRDDRGRPEYAVGMVEDITARKVAESALLASEARHRAVVDTAHDAIVTIGADGTSRAFNREAKRIFGYAAADAIGAPLTLLMPATYRPAHSAGLARHLATGEARVLGQTLALAGRRADGSEFPLELTIAAWATGGETAYSGILRYVSAREAERAALAASAANLAEAQRIAQVGSWEHDFATGTLRCSNEIFRIGGYAPQAFDPTPERLAAGIHPDDRARVASAFRAALREGTAYALDFRVVRPDGTVRVVHQRAEVLRDAAGRPRGRWASCRMSPRSARWRAGWRTRRRTMR